MSRKAEPEDIYLEIGFRSPEPDGSLRTIELFGVPGQQLRSGECTVTKKTQQFFNDLIISKIFRESRRLHNCDFQQLKIWLYDTEARNSESGYQLPTIDNRDLEIRSNVSASKLEIIYVLDNELTGQEYERWRKNVEDLFTPLFREFIAPPEPPSILADNPVVKMFEAMNDTIDWYSQMKKSLFFNALIIQVD